MIEHAGAQHHARARRQRVAREKVAILHARLEALDVGVFLGRFARRLILGAQLIEQGARFIHPRASQSL